ncbi:MAG: pilus assembly protein PilM [Lachnospiraceae bacterium]|nr:pilus assembly protein PilM [Lachnospiraceae bacterium]
MGSNTDKDYVFGLDIGTRNVVGTVGYNDDNGFHIVGQFSEEHDSRSMIDGQIHDIARVAKTVENVKVALEDKLKMKLENVCIAAAGRVLRTITTRVEYDYVEETVVSGEDLHTLDLLGVDQAQKTLQENNDGKYKYYCVGYSVMKYYLNGELFTSLEGHKANKIEEVIIVTFLPEDVVDGLYSAVEKAGLKVANLTLEPIAAINVAIPENFRMLNIALVDVGAGTSDICITRDGSIIAYGMIPYAGDELTEVIVHEYLVDFATAEHIKKTSSEEKEVTYDDIMGLTHTIPSKDVWKLVDPIREKMADAVAEKIIELNGDKPVSAAFVVGGGGRIHGFTDVLAAKLGIAKERVAIRGEEVMKNVIFEANDLTKDSLIVTPIGICLNYYEQKNNFIMIHFNDEMMKLYDNGHLTVVDAAMQAGWDTDELFPKRGKEIHYMVNGVSRMTRGQEGESAVVKMNDHIVGLNTPLEANSYITIEASTEGGKASLTIEQLDEFTSDKVSFIVSGKQVTCPKFVEVNGSLEPGNYEIKEGDVIETRSFYTVGQIAEFMDVEIDENHRILVNNRDADKDTLVYENFNVDWTLTGYGATEGEGGNTIVEAMKENGDILDVPEPEIDNIVDEIIEDGASSDEAANIDATDTEEIDTDVTDADSTDFEEPGEDETGAEESSDDISSSSTSTSGTSTSGTSTSGTSTTSIGSAGMSGSNLTPLSEEEYKNKFGDSTISIPLNVIVNGESVVLKGKDKYVFVDVFDAIDFDTRDSRGRAIVTLINGKRCGYSDRLKVGDKIEIYWKEM